MPPGDDDKRSITAALINAKLDTLLEKLAEYKEDLETQEERLRKLELTLVRLEPAIKFLSRISAILGGLVIALLFKMLTGEARVIVP